MTHHAVIVSRLDPSVVQANTGNLRQGVSLLALNVDYSGDQVRLPPKATLTTFPDPWRAFALPTTRLSHFASCVGFEGVQNYFRVAVRGHHGMHVVCPNIAGPQLPSANSADLIDSLFYCGPASLTEIDGWAF
ncbi:MAG: hypothetical protein JWM21_119 [Acidobacteria bacterium]|nr:hypothetical protein [Acidobacteriota bacterium]